MRTRSMECRRCSGPTSPLFLSSMRCALPSGPCARRRAGSTRLSTCRCGLSGPCSPRQAAPLRKALRPCACAAKGCQLKCAVLQVNFFVTNRVITVPSVEEHERFLLQHLGLPCHYHVIVRCAVRARAAGSARLRRLLHLPATRISCASSSIIPYRNPGPGPCLLAAGRQAGRQQLAARMIAQCVLQHRLASVGGGREMGREQGADGCLLVVLCCLRSDKLCCWDLAALQGLGSSGFGVPRSRL